MAVSVENSSKIEGGRKAAIFFVSIDEESASTIFSQFQREEIEAISLEIAKLEMHPATKDERDSVLAEFNHLKLAHQFMEQGGVSYARVLLERTLPPEEARRIIETIEQSMKMSPFGFLQKAESDNLLTFIQEEHPQTIALILSYTMPTMSAEILEGLPLKKQQDVVKRLSTMEQTSPEVIEQVERALESRMAQFMTSELRDTGGVAATAEMLNHAQRTTERNILEGLEESDPELVEQIRRLMFTFDDIIRVDDKGVQNLLKQIDNQQLALALKTVSPELKEKFFRNVSKRGSEMIKEEMEFMGPVRISDVETAQQAIVDIVRRLEEQGEVIIEGRGGGDEIIA